MARSLPPQDVPMLDASGRVVPAWYDWFQSKDQLKLAQLKDVSTTAPTNGQVLIWNGTTKLFTPGSN